MASGLEACAHALAGSTGGILAMTLLYPLENIRTRLQVQVQPKAQPAGTPPLSNAPVLARPPHTCQGGDGGSARAAEECISPETPHQQRKAAEQPRAETAIAKSQHVALHSVKMRPLAPTCLACILESSTGASSSSSASSVVAPVPASAAPPAAPGEYQFKGSLDVVRQVCLREGWTKLYSGLNSALIGVGASSAVYFFFYYTFKSLVLAHTGKQSMGPIANLAVASVAGVVNVFMTLPIWLVNTRMAIAPKGEYASVFDALRKIHGEEGLKGFYRGLMPSLILVSNPAIQFVVYEQMVALYLRAAHKTAVAVAGGGTAAAPVRLSSLQYFLLGAFAKAVATVVTYPYQVIKSRLQASKHSSQSTWSLLVQMWRQEGVGSFYSGMNAKLSQTVLNSAVMFAAYERLVRIMLRFLQWIRTSYTTLPKPL